MKYLYKHEKKSKSIAGISRDNAMMAAGYCLGLAIRETPSLDKYDRNMLKIAGQALAALCREYWKDWYKQ